MKSKNPNKKEITIIEPEIVKNMVYIIRDQKVMLDFELAELYGYETKNFNQQVKRNIEKFDETFRFQLSKEEIDNLAGSQIATSQKWEDEKTLDKTDLARCQNVTPRKNDDEIEQNDDNLARSKKSASRNIDEHDSFDLARSQFVTPRIWTVGNAGGRTSLPYAFTEQGVYMLMTILKGEVATKQSIALIKMFKDMKDYIIGSNNLLTTNEILKLSKQVDSNTEHIKEIETKLETVMDNFIDPNKYKEFIIKDNQRIEADIFFQETYKTAKKEIIIIDDYIGIKTLNNLKVVDSSVKVIIASDNGARVKLSDTEIEDFIKDTHIDIRLISSKGLFHDRYLIIDYKTDDEVIFDYGASSKDAGNSVATVKQLEFPDRYHEVIDRLFEEKY